MALKRRLIGRIIRGTERILIEFGSTHAAKPCESGIATTSVPVPEYDSDVATNASMPGLQPGPQGPSRVLEQFRTNMNHLTGMILPRGEERAAWRCIGIGKGVRRRPRVKSTRPPVGQIGSPGAPRRLPDAKASRGAPRLPGKPICSHQIDSYLSGIALALIEHDDDDAGAHETVAEAWRLAREFDAEIALGQLVNWNVGSRSLFPGEFLANELEAALCEPAKRHLEIIAEDIGIDQPAVMATALLDRKYAANKIIGDWLPDRIIVHKRSHFEFARQDSAYFETPAGRISSRIQCAGTNVT